MIAMITIVINPPQWIADTPPQEVGWLRELESQDISLYMHYCLRRNSSRVHISAWETQENKDWVT